MDPRDEAAAIRRAQAGDRAAYGRLVEAFQLPLRAVTARYLADPEDVLDIVQEAFIAAWRQLPDFDPERPFWPWLRTIARNLALKEVRRRDRRPTQVLLREDLDGAEEPMPEDADSAGALLARLRSCLDQLQPDQRALLQQRFFHHRPVQEIAAAADLKPNTLSMRLNRLRQAMRRCVEAGA